MIGADTAPLVEVGISSSLQPGLLVLLDMKMSTRARVPTAFTCSRQQHTYNAQKASASGAAE